MNESVAEPSPSVTAVIDSGVTVTRGSDGVNGAAGPRNEREEACAKTRPSLAVAGRENMSRSTRLRRGPRQRAVTGGEEGLAGPVRREMKPETSDTPADAACDLEQLESDRPDGRRRQSRRGEDVAPKVREQQQRETMQLQAEGVRAEAMTAESIGVDVELEFLDPILRRPAVVIPGDEIGGAAAPVGDHEADVEALGRDVDLDQDATSVRPTSGPMPEAGAKVDRLAGSIVPPVRLRDEPGDASLEDAIGADAQDVANPLGFQFRLDRGRRHPGIAAQEDRRVRKAAPQWPQQMPEVVHHTRGTRIPPGSQPRAQQQARTPFEPDQRVIHVLVVPAMKERELLGPVRRVIGAVEIEHEIGRVLVGPVGVRAEPVDAGTGEALNRGPVDRVLQAREGRLRAERRAAIGRDGLKGRVVSEPVGIVDVLVPCGDLIQPLADERIQFMNDVARVSRVGDAADHITAEAELLIEFSNEQQSGIRRERAAGKIDDEFWLESEAKLAITLCSHRSSSVGIPSRPKSPRTYHDFFEGDGVFTYSFMNYPG